MAARHQARPSRKGRQDKEHGGDVCRRNPPDAHTAVSDNIHSYLHSLAIKEYQIVDFFLPKLKDEVMKIKPVQKQTRAGQRTRFKAIVLIGDSEGHIGLGIKTSKEVATAIRAAIIIAKLSVLPVRRGYWGTNLGEPHSLPVKQSAKCGSVSVRVRYDRTR